MRPLVLPPADSPLFAVAHVPPPDVPPHGRILLVPPIGEELNRCRLAIATAARRFARRGWLTLVVDLFGTGDSPGDFGEATVERWRDDLRRGRQWLRSHGGDEDVLWAVRGGASLALSMGDELEAGRLVLWAPQFSGRDAVDTVLRLATAADALAQRDRQVPARERIRGEGVIEIGGYRWSNALLSGLEALGGGDLRMSGDDDLLWLEPQGRNVTPPALFPARPTAVPDGTAFWRTAEPMAADAWAAATERWLLREAA